MRTLAPLTKLKGPSDEEDIEKIKGKQKETLNDRLPNADKQWQENNMRYQLMKKKWLTEY